MYYITKQILPALARIFNIVGVDVKSWYKDMPRNLISKKSARKDTRTRRIDEYYHSTCCYICGSTGADSSERFSFLSDHH